MKVEIHQIQRDLTVSHDPPMFGIGEPLLSATFKQSGYGDPTVLEPLVERRRTERREKIGLFATPGDDHSKIIAGMFIEQDTGHHPTVEDNFPGYMERWREEYRDKKIFFAGRLFKNLIYWDKDDVQQAAGLLIVAAFDVMVQFGVHIGVIVINQDEHEKIYERLGFVPVAEVERMIGMEKRARGMLMRVTPETMNGKAIKRVRDILGSRM